MEKSFVDDAKLFLYSVVAFILLFFSSNAVVASAESADVEEVPNEQVVDSEEVIEVENTSAEETTESLEEETSEVKESSELLEEEETTESDVTSEVVEDEAVSETEEDTSEAEIVSEEVEESSEVVEEETSEVSEEETTSEVETVTTTEVTATATGAAIKATDNEKIDVDRVYGQNRYKNAAAISQEGWTTSDKVYLVNGEKFTDALTGAPLAQMNNAPILLTKLDELPAETLAEILRLKASEVVILGGDLSVNDTVEKTLFDNGLNVTRIAGQNRYEQAALVADAIMAVEGENRDAFLVSGETFSDALSISAVAAKSRIPIYLTRPTELHQTVIDAISKVNSWTIIGGPLSVSNQVEARLNSLGGESKRISGQNRYEVNRNILYYYGTGDHLYVASGETFSDALPASVLAAKDNSGILLMKNNTKTINDQQDFAIRQQGVKNYTVIGGPLTVTEETVEDFVDLRFVVYLDPGHGGYESGAAYWGVHEDDINLQVSNKMKKLLEDRGYIVIMSRMSDTAVGLYDRPAEANALNADIFVSVHHNASGSYNSSANGIETYYYRYDADDTTKPKTKDKTTYALAIDQERADNSKALATDIHNSLIRATGAVNRGVHDMGFAVIRETTMPAVLLELGYMSNWNELQKITSNSYQDKLALAVVNGIDNYFL